MGSNTSQFHLCKEFVGENVDKANNTSFGSCVSDFLLSFLLFRKRRKQDGELLRLITEAATPKEHCMSCCHGNQACKTKSSSCPLQFV